MMKKVQAVSYAEGSVLTGFGFIKLLDKVVKIAQQLEKASMAMPLPRLEPANAKLTTRTQLAMTWP